MEKFKFEIPSLERKQDALDYIEEFKECNSNINGAGGLHKYLDNYEDWLKKLENDYQIIPNEENVPNRTYFLVRCSDNKIIGMTNIRTVLNSNLKKHGGNIGYSIRPTERGKGYNKINLYLALKICNDYGIKIAFLDANLNNPASWKTMEALGGLRVKEYYNKEKNCNIVDYNINVKDSINSNKDIYEPTLEKNT